MTATTTTPTDPELPLGTSPAYARMHTIIRRVCYVLLFGLVLEGALTFPLLAIWYGVPELSPAQVCDELQKHMYNDDTRECKTYSFPQPPFRGPTEAQHQTTATDIWGVQPTPITERLDFRELVRRAQEREAASSTTSTSTTSTSTTSVSTTTTTVTPPGSGDGG